MNPRKRRPLVVIGEDNDAIRSDLCDLVSRLPVDVIPVSSGSEMVVLLTDPHPVDLLVTDVELPWMSGLHVATAARHTGLDMPIILLATSPSREMHQHARRLCKAVLIELAVQPDTLLAMICELLFLPAKTEKPRNKPLDLYL